MNYLPQGPNRASSFKFECMWFRHPDFSMLLKQRWVNALTYWDPKMLQFAINILYTKRMIKEWNEKVL